MTLRDRSGAMPSHRKAKRKKRRARRNGKPIGHSRSIPTKLPKVAEHTTPDISPERHFEIGHRYPDLPQFGILRGNWTSPLARYSSSDPHCVMTRDALSPYNTPTETYLRGDKQNLQYFLTDIIGQLEAWGVPIDLFPSMGLRPAPGGYCIRTAWLDDIDSFRDHYEDTYCAHPPTQSYQTPQNRTRRLDTSGFKHLERHFATRTLEQRNKIGQNRVERNLRFSSALRTLLPTLMEMTSGRRQNHQIFRITRSILEHRMLHRNFRDLLPRACLSSLKVTTDSQLSTEWQVSLPAETTLTEQTREHGTHSRIRTQEQNPLHASDNQHRREAPTVRPKWFLPPSGVNWNQREVPRPQGETTRRRRTPQGLIPHSTETDGYLPPAKVDRATQQDVTSNTVKSHGRKRSQKALKWFLPPSGVDWNLWVAGNLTGRNKAEQGCCRGRLEGKGRLGSRDGVEWRRAWLGESWVGEIGAGADWKRAGLGRTWFGDLGNSRVGSKDGDKWWRAWLGATWRGGIEGGVDRWRAWLGRIWYVD